MIRCAVLLAAVCLAAAAGPERQIRRVLDDQVAAWNRGDLDRFAKGYLNSPEILFIGKEMSRGYEAMLQRYRRSYPTPEKMGKLRFSDLEIRMLGPEYANVVGRFHLERGGAAGGNAEGVFTLLFQKAPGGWKIIQDHTS